jgi:hypothetical protein
MKNNHFGVKNVVLALISAYLLVACQDITPLEEPIILPQDSVKTFVFLPENKIATSDDNSTTARFTDPTTRYNHNILGDNIEGGGLLVVRNGKTFYHKLPENQVFEDIQPRLNDLDKDGNWEIITILTHVERGASVAIFKIIGDSLRLFAQNDYIGTPNRWLNIAAIDDLDNNGTTDIAWIQTPHIGGTLRVGHVDNGKLVVVAEKTGMSNHRIGSRNLCLSEITLQNGQKTLFVPTNAYDAVWGWQYKNQQLVQTDTRTQSIDGTKPLFQQMTFQNLVTNKYCIY